MTASRLPVLRGALKKTVQLPISSFNAHGTSSDLRSRCLDQSTGQLYAWQRRARTNNVFRLHDGPPYANGDLHIGHALNKVLKDITNRVQLLEGRGVQFVPGWDCHGLPIELKALESRKEELSKKVTWNAEQSRPCSECALPANPTEMRNLARALATRTVETQREEFKSWGIMADWDKTWKTMDPQFEIQQLEVFKRMVEQGIIYRSLKPVYWSPSTQTALAEAELEYREDHVSRAAWIKYRLGSISDELQAVLSEHTDQVRQNVYLVIWTTMPWTLPSNRAIGYNSTTSYTLVKSQTSDLLLLASSCLARVSEQLGQKLTPVVSFTGSLLGGSFYIDDLWTQNPETRPLLDAEMIDAELGSGLAHFAPGHGPDDFQICRRARIDPFVGVDAQGRFDKSACPLDPTLLEGQYVLGEGNESVLKWVASKDALLKAHDYKHSYPYDWRTKRPVIIKATPQWFANIEHILEPVLQAIEPVRFMPGKGRNRLTQFIKGRKEWCISRQRAWGVPIPALYEVGSGKAIVEARSVDHIVSTIKQRGIDAWWSDAADDVAWIPLYLQNTGQKFVRGKDTMDVWFDSGSSWTQHQDNGIQAQADMYLEGSDQHRGWFQSSLLTYVAAQSDARSKAQAEAPYRSLVTHGFVLDQEGRKMSKSIGNVVSPQNIISGEFMANLPQTPTKNKSKKTQLAKQAMGVDGLRLWAASCDFTNDVRVTPQGMDSINTLWRKLRGTFRYMLGVLDDWNPALRIPQIELAFPQRLALWQSESMLGTVRQAYSDLDYHKALTEISRHVFTDLSAFYFDATKDAAYCGSIEERQAVQDSFAVILVNLQQSLAPIVPAMVQEVWNESPVLLQQALREPILHRTWNENLLDRHDRLSVVERQQIESDFPKLNRILSTISKLQEQARKDKLLGSTLQSDVYFQIPGGNNASMARSFLRLHTKSISVLSVVSQVSLLDDTNIHILGDIRWIKSETICLDEEEVIVHVVSPLLEKCDRCWRFLATANENMEDKLCSRCDDVLINLRTTKPELFEIVP